MIIIISYYKESYRILKSSSNGNKFVRINILNLEMIKLRIYHTDIRFEYPYSIHRLFKFKIKI